jgi:hypothetical protein
MKAAFGGMFPWRVFRNSPEDLRRELLLIIYYQVIMLLMVVG